MPRGVSMLCCWIWIRTVWDFFLVPDVLADMAAVLSAPGVLVINATPAREVLQAPQLDHLRQHLGFATEVVCDDTRVVLAARDNKVLNVAFAEAALVDGLA
mmetsp:Transcript_86538/g.232011  ORF Transcript_86538/g.232011 Transcript_86538/m.232011 type:complete len:101 (+) Transcript_86538:3-305(+)